MLELWQQDIEWLETISQDEDARALFLRMAALSQEGRLEPFLTELRRDDELDDHTKGTCACTRSPAYGSSTATSPVGPPSPTGARRARRAAPSEPPLRSARWAIVDSNHGPPPYQSGALTN